MAVTRASKVEELADLETAFKGTESAVVVDYKGLKVPEVTELRRQVRGARASYKVVKNTLAKRALKGTPFEPLSEHFVGTTAVAYAGEDPVALAKVLTTFAKTTPALQIKAAVVQGRAIKEIKAGKVEFRVDKTGIIHAPIGKLSFGSDKLKENADALIGSVIKAKPSAAKGKYVKGVSLSSTMGPGIKVDEAGVTATAEA